MIKNNHANEIANIAKQNIAQTLNQRNKSKEYAVLYKSLLVCNEIFIHMGIGFNLFWLIALNGNYLNDVVTPAWVGVNSLPLTIPLTIFNLLVIKTKRLRILSFLNGLLLIIIASLGLSHDGNHDWACFILRYDVFNIALGILFTLPYAIISLFLTYCVIKIKNKF
jgi:hypothetical protein